MSNIDIDNEQEFIYDNDLPDTPIEYAPLAPIGVRHKLGRPFKATKLLKEKLYKSTDSNFAVTKYTSGQIKEVGWSLNRGLYVIVKDNSFTTFELIEIFEISRFICRATINSIEYIRADKSDLKTGLVRLNLKGIPHDEVCDGLIKPTMIIKKKKL